MRNREETADMEIFDVAPEQFCLQCALEAIRRHVEQCEQMVSREANERLCGAPE